MASGGLTGAVLPAAPGVYDQAHMARLVDVVNKIIEQLTKPQQVTAATAIFTALPHETPRQNIEGEVYTRVCAACGGTVLCIDQTLPEALAARRSGK